MQKAALIILDGWGIGDESNANAISKAKTPFVDSLYKKAAVANLRTDGLEVGLPEGQMGNSEVGHLNIGAGRVVYQDLVKINRACSDGSIAEKKALMQALALAKESNKPIHLIGLVSDGGVHSHLNHLKVLANLASVQGIQAYIHAFTDGRDTDPKSGISFIADLEQFSQGKKVKIVSLIGRYFAMDRDNRWERVKRAYDLLIHGKGEPMKAPMKAILDAYGNNETDEFIEPRVAVDEAGNPIGRIQDGDVVICFNYRTDRCREISIALTQKAFPEHEMKPLDLHYVTMTNYDNSFKDVQVIFRKENLTNTLGEVLSAANKTQVRIAETEKYPHVTFFFSGGREEPFEGEHRILINSPKVATYDLQPEMSALEVTQAIINHIETDRPDFICLNFANPDMVGHTGNMEAVVKALETVDSCLEKVVNRGEEYGYAFLIIADHGNAEKMINADGSPHTAHTTNPVPCFLYNTGYSELHSGKLADVAPTILSLMDLKKPKEMNGLSLIRNVHTKSFNH